jgi:hypothetical protein
LGKLLQSIVGDKSKQWELVLPQAKFSYNSSMNQSIGKSLFHVVYSRNHMGVLDLVQLPLGDRIRDDGEAFSKHILGDVSEVEVDWQHAIPSKKKKYCAYFR